MSICMCMCGSVGVWTCTVHVQHCSSSLYIPLEGQALHDDNRGPNRAQSLNARVCQSALGLPTSPHCSYAALCSAVSLTGKWWEVTAKDSLVLNHSLGIESPCKVAACPQTHTCICTEAARHKFPQTGMCTCRPAHCNTCTGAHVEKEESSNLNLNVLTGCRSKNRISIFSKSGSLYTDAFRTVLGKLFEKINQLHSVY